MTAKFGEARREAFLAALRETGNQTLAAERAKVSRSWVQLHRADDPAFRRSVEEAVEEAKAGLRQAQAERENGCEPPSGWGFLDGEELVVRGSGGGKRVQIARARLKQWTPRVEARFLVTLAATCNVKAACAEVGMTAAGAYAHRKRWQRFAERWDAAEEEGFVRLEAGLLEHGCNLFSGEDLSGELMPLAPMTVEQALQLLHMHKQRVHGLGKAPGKRWRPPPSLDDPAIRESILRKLETFERVRQAELGEDQRARDEAEWARRRPFDKPGADELGTFEP
jgi:hypothetical protein